MTQVYSLKYAISGAEARVVHDPWLMIRDLVDHGLDSVEQKMKAAGLVPVLDSLSVSVAREVDPLEYVFRTEIIMGEEPEDVR